MIKTPINRGIAQSDLDMAGFDLLNWSGGGGGTGHGIPAGGTTGQLLKKISSTDYDANWATVASGGGSGTPNTVNVKSAPYNATGDGVTDDTVAIQSAINAMAAIGGGVVFFPVGVYLCNGAFDATTNSILKIPPNDAVLGNPPKGIVLLGEYPPGWTAATIAMNGSIIKSTKSGTGLGPAILAAGGPFTANPALPIGSLNQTVVHIRNMRFDVPSNPSIFGVRLEYAAWAVVEDCIIGTASGNVVQPTHTVTGLRMPCSNNFGTNFLNRVMVFGFDTGIQTGEHFRATHAYATLCNTGIEFMDAYHPSWGILIIDRCPTLIRFTGFSGPPVDLTCDLERGNTGWYVTTTDVADPNYCARGTIRFNLNVTGSGSHDFGDIVVTGGSQLNFIDMYNTRTKPLAYGYFVTAPATGTVGTPTAVFTAKLPFSSAPGGIGVTITPSDGGGGGTFTPSAVVLTGGAPSATFTYTAGSTGSKTISYLNNAGWPNPANATVVIS